MPQHIQDTQTKALENKLKAGTLGFRFDRDNILKILQNQPKLKTDFELNLFHAKKLRTDYVYNTAALEGNTFTFPEVETLLSGITVGGRKLSEHQQILNQNASWLKLINLLGAKKFVPNLEIIFALHEKAAFEEAREWGKLRTGEVKIGGTEYKPPKAEFLPKIFESGLEALNKEDNIFLQAFSAFLFFSINQFFWDGNKRTGRLIMNGVLLSKGLPMFTLLAKDRLEISRLIIDFYESRNASNMLEFLIEKYFSSDLVSFFII